MRIIDYGLVAAIVFMGLLCGMELRRNYIYENIMSREMIGKQMDTITADTLEKTVSELFEEYPGSWLEYMPKSIDKYIEIFADEMSFITGKSKETIYKDNYINFFVAWGEKLYIYDMTGKQKEIKLKNYKGDQQVQVYDSKEIKQQHIIEAMEEYLGYKLSLSPYATSRINTIGDYSVSVVYRRLVGTLETQSYDIAAFSSAKVVVNDKADN